MEQTLIPEIYTYEPRESQNSYYNKITVNGNEFHPIHTCIKIDYGGKYAKVPNSIEVNYISPKKITFLFPIDLPKGYYYFRVIRFLNTDSQVGAQRFVDSKEFNSNYSYYYHKKH